MTDLEIRKRAEVLNARLEVMRELVRCLHVQCTYVARGPLLIQIDLSILLS
jgi:uncharacterized Rmd1/YagE family protein